ncbi:hypothetical protein JKY72_05770 [Candidatus Gracilibacteria bacterium]|nr:hypothetical protein [Candidatus Gracilibacteria bacterium]
MRFQKKGLIYKAEKVNEWWNSHTQSPVAIVLGDKIRIYLGCFAEDGIVRMGFVDVDPENEMKVLKISDNPVLDLGQPGAFDDNGVFPASAIEKDGKIYLYYTGFQKADKIRYTMFGGLAVSEDGGDSFERVQEFPVTDRSEEGLFFRGGPSVIDQGDKFMVSYSAGSEWETVGGKERPCYDIYISESKDGVNFPLRGRKVLSYDRAKGEHGTGRPLIKYIGGKYHMYFCVRMMDMKYSMGYAWSDDGQNWTRDDEAMGFSHSEEGWDSEMVYFPSVLEYGEKVYMFYCGNDYGRDGIGWAEVQN